MSLEHILLGLLREPASGYDLKAAFDHAIRHFWSAEFSQIYPSLRRLERRGLLTSHVEPSPRGPDRRVYRRTAAGTRALREWLAEPPQLGDERFAYVAQLYFLGEAGDLGQTLSFLRMLRERRAEQLATYREIERAWLAEEGGTADDMPDSTFHQYLTLTAGMAAAEARLRWCDNAIARMEKRMKGTARRRPSERRKTR